MSLESGVEYWKVTMRKIGMRECKESVGEGETEFDGAENESPNLCGDSD